MKEPDWRALMPLVHFNPGSRLKTVQQCLQVPRSPQPSQTPLCLEESDQVASLHGGAPVRHDQRCAPCGGNPGRKEIRGRPLQIFLQPNPSTDLVKLLFNGCGSKPMVPSWGGAPPILVYFSGDWDVRWRYGIMTHGQIRKPR